MVPIKLGQNFLSAYGVFFFNFLNFYLFLKRTRRKHLGEIVKNGEFLVKGGFWWLEKTQTL